METLVALVYFILPLAVGLMDDQYYCAVRYKRLCKGKGRHVGCQFSQSGPGMLCRNYSPIQFHNDFKKFITHYINRRRQRIASGNERVRGGVHLPKPEVMMMVEWDRELAALAQRLADQCSFVHDDCRATVRYPYAGQTVGEVRWRRSREPHAQAQRAARRVLDAWWGERRRVHPAQLTQPFRITSRGAVWGHFSQLAVWSLRAVGCGAVRHGTIYPRMLLVCDFSHTNMLGQRTLTPGELAPCPLHTARRPRSLYPLLCAPVRHRLSTEQYEVDPEEEPSDEELSNEDLSPEDNTEISVRDRPTTQPATTPDDTPTRHGPAWRTQLQASTKVARTNELPDEDEAMKGILLRREPCTKKTTKRIFMDVLDRELESRLKAQYKFMKLHDWLSRPTDRSRAEFDEYHMMFKDKRITPTARTKMVKYSRPDDALNIRPRNDSSSDAQPMLIVRHKWQQTRDRPQRPGASALLNVPVTAYTRRPPLAGMKLDKEDVDQLFRDTGFNPSWMRQRI